MCSTLLVSKTPFCKTFEGSTLLSKSESKIDEEHTLFFLHTRAVTAKPRSHPALERVDEILRGPGEREDDLSLTAVPTQHSSIQPDTLRPRQGGKHSWIGVK